MKKILKFLGFFTLFLIIMAILAPSSEERNKKTKKEIEQIKNNILNIPIYDIETNLIAYSKLTEYYPFNESYKIKFIKYKKMETYEKLCRIGSRKMDYLKIINVETYNEKYKNIEWLNSKELFVKTKFISENSFKRPIGFISKYKCSILNNQVSLKNIFFRIDL